MVTNSVKRMTHFLSASVAIALTLSISGCGGGAETNTDVAAVDTSTSIDDWRLVWSDEFDGTMIDTSKWTHEVNCDGGGNQEQQCYTANEENSFVSDGTLKIVAKPSVDGEDLPYTSARMVTKNKGDWTYGRFEMRAKLPFGQGTWPAFWMLSTDEVYGEWPRSGEIDIVEAVNLKELDANGDMENSIVGTLYYGGGADANGQFDSSGKTFDMLDGSNPADDFNHYAVEWQAGEIRWYVNDYLYARQRSSTLRTNSRGEVLGFVDDGRGWYAEFFDQVTGEVKTDWSTAPFDQDFHLLLNLAVGGAFAGNTNNAPNFTNPKGIDPAAFVDGQTYEIDYVRVYKCTADTSTGAGCENLRSGYSEVASEENPTGALVLGVAPTPEPPLGPERGLVIFADEELVGWPLWDNTELSTPMVVVDDDATYGAVAEFEIISSEGTVMGFNSRLSDDQETFNATGIASAGTISFDMKVVTAPAGTNNWLLKVEADGSGGTNTGDLLFLHESDEGQFPVEGVWQTYTFSVSALAEAGLSLGLIDLIMVFPQFGDGEGAVYRIDNMAFNVGGDGGGGVEARTEVFYDDVLADGLSYDSFNPDGVVSFDAEVAEDGRGNVIEVVKTGANGNFYFVAPAGGYDLSSWEADGDLVFDLNVSSLDAGVELYVKFDSGWPNVSDYSVTLPTTGEWATIRIPVADILANGNTFGDGEADPLNLTNLFVAEPTGVMTFKLDNVRLDIEGTSTETVVETWYDDALADGLTPDSFNPDGVVSYDIAVAEDGRGNVIEVVKTGPNGNFYFVAPAGGFDLSPFESAGELVFDLNVSSFDAGVELYVKFDSGWPNVSDYSVTLPATGQWATIRIPVADILANGNTFGDGEADVFNLTNLFVAEPTGVMTFKLDNVRLEIAGSGPEVTEPTITTWYDDMLADGLSFDSFNPDGVVVGSEVNEDGRGTVIQVEKTGPNGNYYIVAPAGGFDLSPFEASGELVFDLYVTSSGGGVELYVKFDSGWPNVSDYSVPLPAEGVWTEVRVSVAEVLANGNSFGDGTADVFNLTNLFVVEPTGVMTFKVDNIRLEN